MWYVIQTQSGNEQKLKELLDSLPERRLYQNCFIPLFEDVYRKGGVGHISIRRLFPGYLFMETEQPEQIFRVLKKLPEFTRFLGMEEKDGEKIFLPIELEEEAFLRSIMEDGLMHVSFLRRAKSGRIEYIIGPLARYGDRITKLDIPHRRAIVEAELFGKLRRVKFSLWTDADRPLAWLDRKMRREEPARPQQTATDIGLHAGDRIVDENGVYGDQVFTVESVNPEHRTIRVSAELFGMRVPVEMRADDVRKV